LHFSKGQLRPLCLQQEEVGQGGGQDEQDEIGQHEHGWQGGHGGQDEHGGQGRHGGHDKQGGQGWQDKQGGQDWQDNQGGQGEQDEQGGQDEQDGGGQSEGQGLPHPTGIDQRPSKNCCALRYLLGAYKLVLVSQYVPSYPGGQLHTFGLTHLPPLIQGLAHTAAIRTKQTC
jgi:hypothetical protein